MQQFSGGSMAKASTERTKDIAHDHLLITDISMRLLILEPNVSCVGNKVMRADNDLVLK